MCACRYCTAPVAHASTTTARTASLFLGSDDLHGKGGIVGRNRRDDGGKMRKSSWHIFKRRRGGSSLGERTGFVAQGVRDEQEEEGANSRDYERDSGVARGGWMDGRGGVCQIDLLFSGDTRPAKLPTTTVVLFCFLEFV